jgi:hypothetical protein
VQSWLGWSLRQERLIGALVALGRAFARLAGPEVRRETDVGETQLVELAENLDRLLHRAGAVIDRGQ